MGIYGIYNGIFVGIYTGIYGKRMHNQRPSNFQAANSSGMMKNPSETPISRPSLALKIGGGSRPIFLSH